MLSDRIVCGVLDEALQRRLLAEPKLNFKEAEEKALAAETGAMNARLLRPECADPPQMADVHQTTTKGKQAAIQSKEKPCFRCHIEPT